MAYVRADLISEVSLTEEFGEIVEAVTTYLVRMPKNQPGGFYFAALANADVPQPGDSLNSQYPDVKVEQRSITGITQLDDNFAGVMIRIVFRLQRSGTPFSLSGGSAAVEVETEVDRNGDQITVEHDGKTQGGKAKVFQAQSSANFETVEDTDTPEATADAWINQVNSATWRGKDPRTWLCTKAEYTPADLTASPKKWHFAWTFEHNPDGWDPLVSYVDPETGTIPPDLVDGTGIKSIEWQDEKDFNSKFP